MARINTLMGTVEDLENDRLTNGVDEEAVEVPGEVRDAEDEVTDGEDTLDEAGDDIETLEEVKEILDDAADNGEGLDETAAKIVEATVEKIYARLGIQSSNVVGSLESFKNPRSRVTATRMAAEDIGDKVSRAWAAVKRFFKELWEKIKGLWKKYTTAVGRLKARAVSVRNKLNKNAGSVKKEDSFDSKEYSQAFNDKAGTNTLETQMTNTIAILKESDTTRETMITYLDKIEKVTETDSNGGSSSAGDTEVPENAIAKQYTNVTAGKGNTDNFPAAKTMVGNRGLAYYLDEGKEKFTLDVFEVDVADNDDDTVDVMDKAKLVVVCSQVIQVCDIIDRDKDKINKADKRIATKLDKMGKTKKGDTEEQKTTALQTRIVREVLRANGKMSYLPEKIAIAGCHKALSYAARCATMFEK